MPLEEANAYQQYYSHMTLMSQQSLETWDAINDAMRFDLLDPDPTHLSPQQLDRVIQLTTPLSGSTSSSDTPSDSSPTDTQTAPNTITWDFIFKLRPRPSDLDLQGMAAPHQRTMARLKAANSGPNGTTIDPQALK
jgi:hypothetical protein